jgi:HlyD family secretion protein
LSGGEKAATNPDAKLQPAQIKIGISDGANTEVLEGLNEGDVLVTGAIMADNQPASRPTNPFGGGFRRF